MNANYKRVNFFLEHTNAYYNAPLAKFLNANPQIYKIINPKKTIKGKAIEK